MDVEARLTLAYFGAYPLEAVKQLETWPAEDAAAVLEGFSGGDIASVLEHCMPHLAAAILRRIPQDRTIESLAALPTHAAIAILRQFEPALQGALFAGLDHIVGPSLRLRMAYPDGTAASLADPRVLTLAPDISVSTALDWIKRDPHRATYYHYIVERDGILVGVVTTKELLIADPSQLLATLMNDHLDTVPAEATNQELLQHQQWRLYHTLPVVDRKGQFLGALRYRALRQIAEEAEMAQSGSVLSHALIQIWEAYALVGLRIMTDLSKVVETGVSEAMPGLSHRESETIDGTTPPTS